MKSFIILPLILTSVNALNYQTDSSIISFQLINEVFHSTDCFLSDTNIVYVNNDTSYLLTYKDSNTKETLGTILAVPNELNKYQIEAIYEKDAYPDISNNKKYYISPYEYIDKTSYDNFTLKQRKNSNLDIISTTYYDESTIGLDKNDFFNINSVDSHLYKYGSSYLNEVRIIDAPNYPNNMFEGNGCVPTAFTMYIAYIQNESTNGKMISSQSLPNTYNSNKSLVNNFIYNLGINYFDTTNTGTQMGENPSYPLATEAFSSYLNDNNLDDYYCRTCTYINDYKLAIEKAANPVPIGIAAYDDYASHVVLGIGYKTIFNGIENTDYVVTNACIKGKEEVVTYAYHQYDNSIKNYVSTFFLIHKENYR